MSSQPVSAWCPPGVRLVSTWCPPGVHLVSWSRTSPRQNRQGQPLPQSVLGEAASSAARTNTFLGARYRRLAPRIGKQKGQVAVAGAMLVTVRKLLADPTRQHDAVGPEFYDHRIGPERHQRNHIRKLETLGYTVTLNAAG